MIKDIAAKNKAFLYFKEVQSIITIFYLSLVGIGMLFEFQKYRIFNINIFQYADVFDFLIAPMRDPKIFIFVFATMVLVYLVIRIDSFILNKLPKLYSKLHFGLVKKSWFGFYRMASFIFLFIMYIFFSSQLLAAFNKKKILDKKESVTITFNDNQIMTGFLIGKTKETIFLLSGEKVKIIPSIALIKEIVME